MRARSRLGAGGTITNRLRMGRLSQDPMRTYVRLSNKGRSYAWLLAAIRRRDLAGLRAAAAELGHQVNLVVALSIALVMADHSDHRHDRAAAKWLARLAYERPAVRLEHLRLGLTALEAPPHNPL